jgi:hypothetical protein
LPKNGRKSAGELDLSLPTRSAHYEAASTLSWAGDPFGLVALSDAQSGVINPDFGTRLFITVFGCQQCALEILRSWWTKPSVERGIDIHIEVWIAYRDPCWFFGLPGRF